MSTYLQTFISAYLHVYIPSDLFTYLIFLSTYRVSTNLYIYIYLYIHIFVPYIHAFYAYLCAVHIYCYIYISNLYLNLYIIQYTHVSGTAHFNWLPGASWYRVVADVCGAALASCTAHFYWDARWKEREERQFGKSPFKLYG